MKDGAQRIDFTKFQNIALSFMICAVLTGCAFPASQAETNTGATPAETPAPAVAPSPQPATPSTPPNAPAPVIATLDLPPLRLPAPPTRRAVSNAQITQAKNKLAKYPTSAGYRRLAELYIATAQFEEAAKAYRAEAAIYRAKGLNDAASIQENKAARYETQIRLSVVRLPAEAELKTLWTRARLEPKTGVYLGAFIDRDEQLREVFKGDNWQTHRHPKEWAKITGKPHASVFTYVQYGKNFPRRWLEMCKRENVIPQIAWEPRSLNEVQDNKYLRDCASFLRKLDWPVFIRFAGEMNGAWTPYHRDPIAYRTKFRLVHKVLTSTAPKVATIWAVNSIPLENIPRYYPGDDGCDWVGINLYSVPFYDNNRNRPAFQDDPLTLIEPIYKRYAAKKPIAIGEYAASHQAALDKVLRTDFAIEKMSLLYQSLPVRFPRIKFISWYSSNNIANARPGRQLNNYNLTAQQPVLNAYRKLIASEYFLSEPRPPQQPVALPLSLRENEKLPRAFRINLWVKTYTTRPKLFLAIGDKLLLTANGAGAHEQEVTIPASVPPGNRVLALYLYDEKNRFIAQRRITVALPANS